MIAISPISAFNDNYIWLIHKEGKSVVVDPGDAAAVTNFLEANSLDLNGILITHHHADHTDGVASLKRRYQCPVWGPANDPVNDLDYSCEQNQQIEIDSLDVALRVLALPGHTLGHIAFFLAASDDTPNALFCGDTLFSGGCGRLFEGSAEQMWHSLQKLIGLPDDTLIFAAHEYTLSNLEFALNVEPENQSLQDYYHRARELRNNGRPTLPSSLALEKNINPFLRVNSFDVIKAAQQRSQRHDLDEIQVFSVIRQWKDQF